ncbi:urease accessory protein UreD [Terrihabitans soli]|uniref:Urease accessory protein UreD n=1 Tax=Terrihabitans soli TaxID=708113 RepID=A0A6S6QY66_9HYPH|nr:urease accessory protein UreD [Terrihabitans soli]BCJ91518.1 urease accessory protein UreD [Terrihabitans soli]
MYATAWSSDGFSAPRRQRAHGQLSFEVAVSDGRTRPVRIGESGPSRIRLPNVETPCLEAVMMNTGGGIACGDRFDVSILATEGSELVMTTPAAERCYRSDGAVAAVDVDLRVASGASLAWLPQETLLYNEGRLRRRLSAEIAEDAKLMMFECAVFGRTAHRETVETGLFEDRWRISRAGRLVYADTLRLDGPIQSLLDRPSVAKGSRAIATFLYVAPDAESRIDEARELLAGAPCDAAASAWNGVLAIRFLAPEIAALRRAAIDFITAFRGTPLPRVWHS